MQIQADPASHQLLSSYVFERSVPGGGWKIHSSSALVKELGCEKLLKTFRKFAILSPKKIEENRQLSFMVINEFQLNFILLSN